MIAPIIYLSIGFLALLGTPFFVVMAFLALVAFHFAGIESSAVAVEIFRLAQAPSLLTIPLFTFAGYIMAESQTPKRLLNLTEAALGWLPGGVAIVSIFVCAFFTAFTGASGVTIVALGGLLFPILTKEGLSEKFSMGLISSCGSLGLLFPPSLPIILYGVVAKVDIDQLFRAGLLPGLLIIFVLSFWSIRNGKRDVAKRKFNWGNLKKAMWEARYEIPLPFMVLYGIYGGLTTASEAAAFTLLYVLIMNCLLYRDVSITKDIPEIVYESMTLVGAILLILTCALGLTSYLVDEQVPMKIMNVMKQFITSKWAFLMFLNVFLLIVGSVMEIFGSIIVVLPLIIPIAKEFGVHPIHLAIIFLTNLEIGYITPPLGINLFISSFRFKKPVFEMYKATIPFLILQFLALMVITYVPELSLALIKSSAP